MTTNNYYRLAFTDKRELSDYTMNEYSRTSQEIRDLINNKQSDVLADLLDDTKYPIYAERYDWLPEKYLIQFYNQIIRFIDSGFVVFFLDNEVDDHHWGVELMAAILEAFAINDYKDELVAGEPLNIRPKALSRTTGSQTLGDMSLTFESERLSMKLEGSFEQFLSTVSNGIEIINRYKSFKAKIPNFGIV